MRSAGCQSVSPPETHALEDVYDESILNRFAFAAPVFAQKYDPPAHGDLAVPPKLTDRQLDELTKAAPQLDEALPLANDAHGQFIKGEFIIAPSEHGKIVFYRYRARLHEGRLTLYGTNMTAKAQLRLNCERPSADSPWSW